MLARTRVPEDHNPRTRRANMYFHQILRPTLLDITCGLISYSFAIAKRAVHLVDQDVVSLLSGDGQKLLPSFSFEEANLLKAHTLS